MQRIALFLLIFVHIAVLAAGCRCPDWGKPYFPLRQLFINQQPTEIPVSEQVFETLKPQSGKTDDMLSALTKEQAPFRQVFEQLDSENAEHLQTLEKTIKRPSISTHYINPVLPQNPPGEPPPESQAASTVRSAQNAVSQREQEFINTVWQKNGEKFKLNMSGAIALGLANNPDFASQKLQPSITATNEMQAISVFDPQLQAKISGTAGHGLYGDANGYPFGHQPQSSSTTEVGFQKYLPSGSTLGVTGSFANSRGEETIERIHNVSDSVSLEWQHHLLNGGGYGVNLATIRQARLQTLYSRYEFRAYAQNFIAKIENACWDYIEAVQTLAIDQEMYALTKQNWEESIERINNGLQAASDRFSFVSQLSQQETALVQTHCDVESKRVALMQLISPHTKQYWNSDIELTFDLIPVCDNLLSCDGHIEMARNNRPDIAQARLQIQSGQLELVKTANGLLPKLDFFMSLDWSGYGETIRRNTVSMSKKEELTSTVGLSLQQQLGNRAAKAEHRAAQYSLTQNNMALDNLRHIAESDVYQRYMEVIHCLKSIQYNAVGVVAAKGTYEAENERMKNGLSTSFQVFQAQDQWRQMQYQEVTNIIQLRKKLILLYLADGSMLERRGIGIQ